MENFDVPAALIESAQEREERDPALIMQHFPGATGRMMITLGIRTTVQGWVLLRHIRGIVKNYIAARPIFVSRMNERSNVTAIKAEKVKAAQHLIKLLEDKMPWIKPSPFESGAVDWLNEPSYQIVSHELALYRAATRVRRQRTQEPGNQDSADVGNPGLPTGPLSGAAGVGGVYGNGC